MSGKKETEGASERDAVGRLIDHFASNICIATLNQFPHIAAHYELFHPEHIYGGGWVGSLGS